MVLPWDGRNHHLAAVGRIWPTASTRYRCAGERKRSALVDASGCTADQMVTSTADNVSTGRRSARTDAARTPIPFRTLSTGLRRYSRLVFNEDVINIGYGPPLLVPPDHSWRPESIDHVLRWGGGHFSPLTVEDPAVTADCYLVVPQVTLRISAALSIRRIIWEQSSLIRGVVDAGCAVVVAQVTTAWIRS